MLKFDKYIRNLQSNLIWWLDQSILFTFQPSSLSSYKMNISFELFIYYEEIKLHWIQKLYNFHVYL